MDSNLLKAFASLIGCVGILFAFYLLLKKYAVKKNNSAANQSEAISIVSRMHLPPKGFIYIISVGKRRVLVGATEHNISLIAELTENTASTDGSPIHFPEINSTVSDSKNNVRLSGGSTKDLDSASFATFLKTMLSSDASRK